MQPQAPTIYLSGLRSIELPLPQELGRTVNLSQQVTVEFEGQVNDMLLVMDVTVDEVNMAALTPFGARLFSVTYQPPLIETEVSPLLKKRVKPEYVLADLMLAYWPIEVIHKYLDRAGLSIADNNRETRVISLGNKIIISIEYGAGSDRLRSKVTYHNLKRGYSMTMQPLDVE